MLWPDVESDTSRELCCGQQKQIDDTRASSSQGRVQGGFICAHGQPAMKRRHGRAMEESWCPAPRALWGVESADSAWAPDWQSGPTRRLEPRASTEWL